MLSSKTVENNETSEKTVPDICKNTNTSNDNTTIIAKLRKIAAKEQKKIDECKNVCSVVSLFYRAVLFKKQLT